MTADALRQDEDFFGVEDETPGLVGTDGPKTERERVLEAAIALADCDDSDEEAWRSAWEQMRSAAKAWLGVTVSGRVTTGTGTQLRRTFQAFTLMRQPIGSRELGARLGICKDAANDMVAAMRKAGLPVESARAPGDRRQIKHVLRMPSMNGPDRFTR